jgi:predicted alpha/beta hydrolase
MERVTITTEDGWPLAATLWASVPKNEGVVLINNAMGVRQAYYHDFARFLQAEGFTTVTWDYRGVGESLVGPLRYVAADYWVWADVDQTAVIDWIMQQVSDCRLMVVGHSLGGQIPALTRRYALVTALLGIASQSGYWRHWSGWGRVRMWLLGHVLLPGLPLVWGYFPSRLVGMGQDIPAKAAVTWARGIRSPRYMLDIYPDRHHFGRMTCPISVLGFTDDAYAPAPAVEAFGRFFSSAPVSVRFVSPADIAQPTLGHFGYFRRAVGGALWPEAAAWLRAKAQEPAAASR